MGKKPEIYVKLPSGTWVRIIGKIERIIRVRGRKRERQVISHTLVGESIENKPDIPGKTATTFYISSSSVTKYLMKILEYNIDKPVVFEPFTPEVYRVKIYDKNVAIKLVKLAEEMKIIRHPKKKSSVKVS